MSFFIVEKSIWEKFKYSYNQGSELLSVIAFTRVLYRGLFCFCIVGYLFKHNKLFDWTYVFNYALPETLVPTFSFFCFQFGYFKFRWISWWCTTLNCDGTSTCFNCFRCNVSNGFWERVLIFTCDSANTFLYHFLLTPSLQSGFLLKKNFSSLWFSFSNQLKPIVTDLC